MAENPEAGVPESESATPQAEPRKRRGCGLFTWIVILAVGLVVATVIIRQAQVQQQKKLEEEKQTRRMTRDSQITQVGQDVAKAVELIRQGDVSRGLDTLQAQDSLLTAIGSEASSNGDTESANSVLAKKTAVSNALAAIKQKQQEFRAFAEEQATGLSTVFPQVKRAVEAAPPKGTGPAPGQPAAGTPPGQGGGTLPAGTPAPTGTQPPAAQPPASVSPPVPSGQTPPPVPPAAAPPAPAQPGP